MRSPTFFHQLIRPVLICSLSVIFSFVFSCEKAQADSLPYYGEVIGNQADQVLVKFRTLEDNRYMICRVSNVHCSQVSTSTPELYSSFGITIGDSSYYTSPDGTILLIEQNTNPSNTTVFSLYQTQLAKPQNTLAPSSLTIPRKVWRALISQDNSKILFFVNDGIICFDIASQTLSPILPFSWRNYDHYLFSPSGNYLAYFQNDNGARTQRTYGLYDFKLQKSFETNQTVKFWDHVAEEYPIFSFSPDETHFLYLSDNSGYIDPYEVILPLQSKRISGIKMIQKSQKSFSINDAVYISSNKVAMIDNHLAPYDWSLDIYDTSTQSFTVIDQNVSYGVSLNLVGNTISYATLTKMGQSPAIYNIANTSIERIAPSFLNDPSKPNDISATLDPLTSVFTMKDGTTAILWKGSEANTFLQRGQPTDNSSTTQATPKNLIVWLHGGPDRQTSIGYHSYLSYGVFDWVLERLREQGNDILSLDYPGSYGYGSAYSDSISKNIGKLDVQTVLDDIKTIQKNTDIGNVYLMGNSYGAYLALRTLVEKPQLFKGAISINGVTNWYTLIHTMDPSPFESYFGHHPKSSANDFLYNQASIRQRVNKLTNQGILLFHGNADTSVPYYQSQSLNDYLQTKNKNVSFTTYDGEDHVYAQKATVSDLCQKILNFVANDGKVTNLLVAPQSTCLLQ